MAELDGSVFDRPVAAFQVIPYFARRLLKLADLDKLLDISQECLHAMEDSQLTDDDTNNDDNDEEDTDTSSIRLAEDDDAASATSD